MKVHAFRGEKLPGKSLKSLKRTDGILRHMKRTGPPGKKKNVTAMYEYTAEGQKYFKTICFYGQKEKDGAYLIRCPEKITVFYDEEHPRFSCWGKIESEMDLELSSLRS